MLRIKRLSGDGILAKYVRPLRGVYNNRQRLNGHKDSPIIEIIQSRIYTAVAHWDVKVKVGSYKKKGRTSVINGNR